MSFSNCLLLACRKITNLYIYLRCWNFTEFIHCSRFWRILLKAYVSVCVCNRRGRDTSVGTDVPWYMCWRLGTTFFELVLFFHLVKTNSHVSAVLCYGIQVNWPMGIRGFPFTTSYLALREQEWLIAQTWPKSDWGGKDSQYINHMQRPEGIWGVSFFFPPFPFLLWVPGIELRSSDWQQELWPAKSSHQPPLKES